MPNPHAAGSTQHSQWWVIDFHGRGASGLKAIMATIKPKTTPFSDYAAGPFGSQGAANNWIQQNQTHGGLPSLPNPFSALGGWLGSLGGSIGSGLEAGFISGIKDLWDVVIGPLEVLIGGIIIVITLVMYFRSDVMNLIGAVGGIAAAV